MHTLRMKEIILDFAYQLDGVTCSRLSMLPDSIDSCIDSCRNCKFRGHMRVLKDKMSVDYRTQRTGPNSKTPYDINLNCSV